MKTVETENKKKLSSRSTLRASVIIFFLLVGTKLLNFLKKILIGRLFGVSFVADAFFAASYLPYYLAIFFEGVLFLGFLPLFSQVMAEKGKKEASQFVTDIFLLISGLTSVLVALAWWKAPWIIGQLVPGFKPAEQDLTRSLFQILSLVVIFISLTSFFKALNSYFGDYALAASSGLVDTVAMFAVVLFSWKMWGIYGAAWGAVAGALTALFSQAIILFRRHLIFSWQFGGQSLWLTKLFYFLIPMGAIWFFQQIPLIILNRFGSGMWEGTISAVNIAYALTTVPMGLVSHTVLFAIFPALAKQATEMTPENLKQTFFQTLRGGLLILIPLGFLLTGFARPFAALFFSGGGISEEGTKRVANSLFCFGWATFALYADLFMTQSLIAIRKTNAAIFLCGTRAILSYTLTYFLSSSLDYQGLALAFSIALVANFFLFFPLFFRLSPFVGKWKSLFSYTGKLVLASSPALLIGWFVNRWSIRDWMSFPSAIAVIGMTLAGLVVAFFYIWFLYRLKIEELQYVLANLKRGWVQKDWTLADPTN